jgi:hypothetical protein
MKVSTEIDNNFGYEKITQLVDNIPLSVCPTKTDSGPVSKSHSACMKNYQKYVHHYDHHYIVKHIYCRNPRKKQCITVPEWI